MKSQAFNIRRACMLYNWHTSPTALRTDDEHERHNKAARKITAWLQKNACEGIQWHENDYTGKRYAA